ncbi:hypothetical protein SpCBS45565_g05517 [Spizellomyces sp. 'palustris']|nr:hypothetical protein SpCBS45565_g05517 [Spizellomyces sp. 'palustris']
MSRPKQESVDLGYFAPPEPEPEAQEEIAIPAQPEVPTPTQEVATPDVKPPPPPPIASLPDRRQGEQYAPTLQEIESDAITQLAHAHWSEGGALEFDPTLVETIWKEQLDGSGYSLRKVMLLEFSQYLEKYLWPSFVPKGSKGKPRSSLAHVLSIVVMVNEKFRECVSGIWDIFSEDTSKFSGLVSRVLRLLVEPLQLAGGEGVELGLQTRRFLLIFLIHLFQSLENAQVRSEFEKRREEELRQYPERLALWERSEVKYSSATKASAKEKMEFDRTFMSKLIKHFVVVLSSIPESGPPPAHSVAYCERFVEFLIDFEAQLPTRRHFNLLLHDHLVVPICNRSKLAQRGRKFLRTNRDLSIVLPSDWGSRGSESGALFVQLLDRLKYYARFEINDFTGAALTAADITHHYYDKIRRLQKVAFVHFRETLEEFALANVGSVESRESLRSYFGKVDEETLRSFCSEIGIRTRRVELESDDAPFYDKAFLIEILIAMYEKRPSQIELINALPLYPDEDFLFDETTVPATQQFPNTHCLAIPKLNLQFLTIHDYLLRNFTLFRLESTYEIRQDIEDVVQRIAPQHNIDRRTGEDQTVFTGWARMGAPIDMFQIVDVGPPKLGDTKPSLVKADVTVNIFKYTDSIRKEWESLRPRDVLFLLTVQMEPDGPGWMETEAKKSGIIESEGSVFRRKFGLKYVRGCEVADLIGDDGLPIEDFASAKLPPPGTNEKPLVTGYKRTFRVLLDTNQYQQDMDRLQRKEGEDVYPTFNVLMRRKPQENNFKAVLDTIRDLMQSDLVVPAWLHNVFLGYGDRNSAHFTKVPEPIRTLDFRDTFLDWDHLIESFPDKRITPAGKRTDGSDPNLAPPYVITFPKSMFSASVSDKEEANTKSSISSGVKRKLGGNMADGDDGAEVDQDADTLLVQTYKPKNMGPYPEDVPKKNTVRFTPTQVQAIHAGSSPGLTMIVGPPGTGKTDVAVQIIANLYHNFPEQHTLIITHSNTALNQLFEKIAALDIDPRHILRLGHGQEELELADAGSWGKYGRVTAFLEKRVQLLGDVDRLAQGLEIPGAHGYTCETAGYFYLYHILSRWEPYIHKVKAIAARGQGTRQDVAIDFPFEVYFADAPQPLFPEEASFDEALEIAEGCWRHIRHVFDELEDIRAFELLRSGYDRSNYLLVKEAKIIAMTCTHAALKRREFVQLGFKYDNVVMEEAAQILEVETFIPLLLQNSDPDTGASRLKRVVMIGDHNQLPPVVKNTAFQRYGNMEQSLFTRFVRLGVPTIQLDAQGRSRSSIAQLFKWKYPRLDDLPAAVGRPEFQLANPGFPFEYQVVNVPSFLGKGETEPRPHFLQNLGEAEYVVAVYQYMRLLGYPAERITILTTYNGQKELIRDILEKRCSWNPLYGNPHKVSTVDKYQGQQNDYILLSLVRTKTVGHLRDVRRLIVAMSRARLGLYVFCRVPLFRECYELQPVFQKLLERPFENLWIRRGEQYAPAGFPRAVEASGVVLKEEGKWGVKNRNQKDKIFAISGVQHMGEYVEQMMKEQIEYLKKQRKTALRQALIGGEVNDGEVNDGDANSGDANGGDAMEGVEGGQE